MQGLVGAAPPEHDSIGMQQAFSFYLLPSPSLGFSKSLGHGPTLLPVSYYLEQGEIIPELNATYYSSLAKSEYSMPLNTMTDEL